MIWRMGRSVITVIGEGRYEKPVATFEDGSKLSLNGTNVGTLIRAFGKDDENWIGQTIELYAGTLRYNGNDNPAVLVRALNPSPAAIRAKPKSQPLRDGRDTKYLLTEEARAREAGGNPALSPSFL